MWKEVFCDRQYSGKNKKIFDQIAWVAPGSARVIWRIVKDCQWASAVSSYRSFEFFAGWNVANPEP